MMICCGRLVVPTLRWRPGVAMARVTVAAPIPATLLSRKGEPWHRLCSEASRSRRTFYASEVMISTDEDSAARYPARGHHVPHGFRDACSIIGNGRAERPGKDHDRKVIDLRFAHVPTDNKSRASIIGLVHALSTRTGHDLVEYAGRGPAGACRPRRAPGEAAGGLSRGRLPKPPARGFTARGLGPDGLTIGIR